MQVTEVMTFGPFRLGPEPPYLWRGTEPVRLRPKTLAVLHHFVTHPQQCITVEELLAQVWQGVHVSRTVLRVCIREIRTVLGDDAQTPHYLETVGRQGYRWLGGPDPDVAAYTSMAHFVGRQYETAALHRWWQQALTGQRQLVFVAGEAGIGKSTVVDVFVAQASLEKQLWFGRGQCVQHYGEGESYLPILQALMQMCRAADGARVLALLRRYAPGWLVQMPGILEVAEQERLQRQGLRVLPSRMMRELADALEILAKEWPVLLVLEDLHWSDAATLTWLEYCLKRRGPARLCILGTYRPAAVALPGPPLRRTLQELYGRPQCAELIVPSLSQEEVATYVARRLGLDAVTEPVASLVYQRTEGNALFMTSLVEHMLRRGLARGTPYSCGWSAEIQPLAAEIPPRLHAILDQQLSELPYDLQRMLEVASVAGVSFTTAEVAAGMQMGVWVMETMCEEVLRYGHVLVADGLAEWPDGTQSGRYRFRHSLYQQVLYDRVGAARRARVHSQLGTRVEAAYGPQVREVAARLAVHFEQGRDLERAVQYRYLAGDNALHRYAYQEAHGHVTRGLELLQALPETALRAQHEIALRLALGVILMATEGYAAPSVNRAEQGGSGAHRACNADVSPVA